MPNKNLLLVDCEEAEPALGDALREHGWDVQCVRQPEEALAQASAMRDAVGLLVPGGEMLQDIEAIERLAGC